MIVFNFFPPVSLITPKIEWIIEPTGSTTVFTAITHMRAGNLLRKIFKKEMIKLINAHDKHVREEAENLKNILEKRKQPVM